MHVTEILSEGLQRQLTVTLPPAMITDAITKRLQELSKTMRLPGFRPGKVPLALMKQRYGASVMGEVLEQTVQTSSAQALTERGLKPAMQPKIEVKSFSEGEGLEYTLALELLPEIAPVDFTRLKLEKLTAPVTDAALTAELEEMRGRARRTKPVAKPRAAATGDTLVMDYVGKIRGVAFDGGTGTDQRVELGGGSLIPGFEDQLVGIKAGETRIITVTFPKEYHAAALAGKNAEFTVTAKELREAHDGPLDDDFAKEIGLDSFAKLQEFVRGQIGQNYAAATRLKMKRALLDDLAGAHNFAVPAGMVEAEFAAIWKQVEAEKQQDNADPEMAGKTDEEQRADYRAIAERRVRLGLLFSDTARRHDIAVTSEELQRAAMAEARRYPGQEQQVIDFYRKNNDALAALRAPILEEKVVDFIFGQAQMTEREVTPEALLSEVDADHPHDAVIGAGAHHDHAHDHDHPHHHDHNHDHEHNHEHDAQPAKAAKNKADNKVQSDKAKVTSTKAKPRPAKQTAKGK